MYFARRVAELGVVQRRAFHIQGEKIDYFLSSMRDQDAVLAGVILIMYRAEKSFFLSVQRRITITCGTTCSFEEK